MKKTKDKVKTDWSFQEALKVYNDILQNGVQPLQIISNLLEISHLASKINVIKSDINMTESIQNKISEIPSSLEKYNLSIGTNMASLNYTYNVQAKQTGITNLLQDLKDAGFKLKDLKTEQSTLEKIFVTLVKENNEI